jgi:hypothetical protein
VSHGEVGLQALLAQNDIFESTDWSESGPWFERAQASGTVRHLSRLEAKQRCHSLTPRLRPRLLYVLHSEIAEPMYAQNLPS